MSTPFWYAKTRKTTCRKMQESEQDGNVLQRDVLPFLLNHLKLRGTFLPRHRSVMTQTSSCTFPQKMPRSSCCQNWWNMLSKPNMLTSIGAAKCHCPSAPIYSSTSSHAKPVYGDAGIQVEPRAVMSFRHQPKGLEPPLQSSFLRAWRREEHTVHEVKKSRMKWEWRDSH